MKVIISEIPEEGLDLEVTEHAVSDALKLLSPLHAILRIDKKGTEVLVRGMVSGDLELQCSRCLKAFPMVMTSPLNVVYHPAEQVVKEEHHHELRGEELETGFYRNDLLDTDELLAEQALLGLPMKPLCAQDCKGICPRCGTDLNVSGCQCDIKEIDARFEKLRQLLKGKE